MILADQLNSTEGLPSTNREINKKLIGSKMVYIGDGVPKGLQGCPGIIVGISKKSPTTNKAILLEIQFKDGFFNPKVPTTRVELLDQSQI